jgi:hypothetical protein
MSRGKMIFQKRARKRPQTRREAIFGVG